MSQDSFNSILQAGIEESYGTNAPPTRISLNLDLTRRCQRERQREVRTRGLSGGGRSPCVRMCTTTPPPPPRPDACDQSVTKINSIAIKEARTVFAHMHVAAARL